MYAALSALVELVDAALYEVCDYWAVLSFRDRRDWVVRIELSEEEALNEWIQLVRWTAECVILHLQRHQDGEVLALVTN